VGIFQRLLLISKRCWYNNAKNQISNLKSQISNLHLKSQMLYISNVKSQNSNPNLKS